MAELTEVDWYNIASGKGTSPEDRDSIKELKIKMDFLIGHLGLEKEYKKHLRELKKIEKANKRRY
jgi:hypothetical protein